MFNGPVFNNEVVQANSRAVNNAGFSESLDEANSLHSRLTGASFELVPSSYKGGTVYSGVPNTGNGDLTWTRASDAWRTNASGLIQRVPWNLLQYSEQFDNSAWIKNNATITSNAINAPNGTLTADKLIETTANGVHNAVFVLSPNVTTYTASFYAKAAERNFVYYSFGGPSWGGQGFMVNLTTGAVSQNTTGTTPTVTLLPDGWVKIEASRAAVSTTQIQFQIFTGLDSTTFSYTGDSTKGIYIWGAQLVEGSSARAYFPTTDRLNVPRLSYMYGSAPALLLEPQRTNLCFYSAQLDDATWTKLNSSITANATTSPDGTTNADKIVETNTTALHGVLQSITTTASTYAISFYAKASERNFIQWNNQVSTEYINFDLTNGAVGSSSGVTNASIQSVGSGWYRCSFNFVSTVVGTAGFMRLIIVTSATSARLENYVGNGTSGLFVWGTQFELGAYPTTHIPTQATTVTRLSDSFSRNNIYTNGLITAAGGTWFVELRNNMAYTGDAGGDAIILGDSSSTLGNNFRLYNPPSSSRLQILKTISTAITTLFTTTTDTIKIAIKWNGSTADVFVNGAKQVSATAFTATALEFFYVNNVAVPRFIKQMALYPIPLSDDQCVALTSDFTEGESVIGSYERYVNSNGGAVENLNTITNLIQNLK